jgi:hypothetical protein
VIELLCGAGLWKEDSAEIGAWMYYFATKGIYPFAF